MPTKPSYFQPRHRPATTPDQDRGTAAERGYDSAWKRFRKWFVSQPGNAVCALRDDPRHRKECTLAVEVVDHIKPLCQGGDRLSESNCRSVCRIGHQRLTDNLKATGRNELPGLPLGGWAS